MNAMIVIISSCLYNAVSILEYAAAMLYDVVKSTSGSISRLQLQLQLQLRKTIALVAK